MKRICLSAAFILAFLSPLSATTVQRLSFDDLVAKAQSIVVGQVIDSRTDWNDGHKLILTSYTIQAQESMKSNASPTVTVTTVGGKVGNTILHVSGMPVLEPGENVILFLEQSNSYTTVVGLNQKENSRYRTARSSNSQREIVRLSTEESEETPERSPVQEYLAKIEAQGGLKGPEG